MTALKITGSMENKDPQTAPGCSSEFYRVKDQGKIVHFYVLPLKWQVVLCCRLAALKHNTVKGGIRLQHVRKVNR